MRIRKTRRMRKTRRKSPILASSTLDTRVKEV